ncbi:ParB/RepB/Spo0J family partition protein [Guggenheimella bovis]
MAKRTGLGKGLGSLLSVQTEQIPENSGVVEIDLDNIRPNTTQPRTYFDEEGLEELKNSILEHGVIQPILVKQVENGYEIIAGERRYRASKLANQKTIPAIVRDYDELTKAKVALVENLQRVDLNIIEEARGYQTLIEDFALTQQELATTIGKSRVAVTNTLRLLELPATVINQIEEGLLTAGHGRAILSGKPEYYEELANIAITKKLSVRDLEKLAKTYKEGTKRRLPKKNPLVESLEREISEKLGTKVELKMGKKKSTMEISFYSEDDLQRIINKLI